MVDVLIFLYNRHYLNKILDIFILILKNIRYVVYKHHYQYILFYKI